MPNTTSLREKHFPALDGLRGLAALMIVLHHSAWSYARTNLFDKAYLRATMPLWIGVDLFFVLSGFLITNILLETKSSKSYLWTFYGRRFLRIFPLYYGFLAVMYWVFPLFGTLSKSLLETQQWQWTYTTNIYYAFFGMPDPNVSHFWTLGIEEQFYFMWPLIVLWLTPAQLKRTLILLFLLLPAVRGLTFALGLPENCLNTFTLCRIDGLLLGALLSIGVHQENYRKWTEKVLRIADRSFITFLVALVLLYVFILRNDTFQMATFTWPWYGQCIGFTLIVLPFGYLVFRCISAGSNIFKQMFAWQPLMRLGKYSYALYLLHAPIVYWIGPHPPTPAFLKPVFSEWGYTRSIYIVLLEATLSIWAAVLSWHLYEKHFLKLKKYFPYRHAVAGEVSSEPTAIFSESAA